MSEEFCEQKSSASLVDAKHRRSVASGDNPESCKGDKVTNKKRRKGRLSGGDLVKQRKDNWRRYAKKYIKAEVYLNKFEPKNKWQDHVDNVINDETFLEHAEKGFSDYDTDEKYMQDEDEYRTGDRGYSDEKQGEAILDISECTHDNKRTDLCGQVSIHDVEASASEKSINCTEKQSSGKKLEVVVDNPINTDQGSHNSGEISKTREYEDEVNDADDEEEDVIVELKQKLTSHDVSDVQDPILEMVEGRKEEKDRICVYDNAVMPTIDEEKEYQDERNASEQTTESTIKRNDIYSPDRIRITQMDKIEELEPEKCNVVTELQPEDTKCTMEGTREHIEHEVENSLDTKLISLPQVGMKPLEEKTFDEVDKDILEKDQEVEWIEENEKIDDLMRELLLD